MYTNYSSVSKCCKYPLIVRQSENCSYYICSKCMVPSQLKLIKEKDHVGGNTESTRFDNET